MTARRFASSSAILAAAALSLPAGASAATITSASPCPRVVPGVVERVLPLSGGGFTPNSAIRFTADDQPVGSAVADAAGNFAAPLFPPSFSSSRRNLQTFQIAAVDSAGVAAPAIAQAVVRLSVGLPSRSRPTRRVAFRAYGFDPGGAVYLHVRRGGRTRGSYRIGTADQPCGRASRRLRYMPLRRYSPGSYDYWFTQTPRYDRRAVPVVRARLTIFRTFRRPRSSAASAGVSVASASASASAVVVRRGAEAVLAPPTAALREGAWGGGALRGGRVAL